MSFSPIILTAAGRSLRMGSPKGLVHCPDGRTWIRAQIGKLEALGFTEIRIVLGFESESYQKELEPINKRILVLQNPDPSRGPFSSLQTGLGDRGNGSEPVFFLPLDVPCPSKDVFQLLSESLKRPQTLVSIPRFKGRSGHPVLLSGDFTKSLCTLDPTHPDARLDRQIETLANHEVNQVDVSDLEVTLNLNTPDAMLEYFSLIAPLRPERL